MNKAVKKLLAVLLVSVLVFAMAVPAFAAENNGSIEISNAVAGEEYHAYKIFDVVGQSGDNVSYKVETKWEAFFRTGAGKDYIALNENGQPAWNNEKDSQFGSSDLEAFAKAALAYAEANKITAAGSVTAQGETGAQVKAEITGLSYGYYLVDTSLGALCSLNTLRGTTATINEKNDVPSIEKKIVENGSKLAENDAKIGDEISYEITIHAKKGATGYVLTDTLSKGLTFEQNTLKIAGLTKGTDYTLETVKNQDGSTTFTVTFTETYLNSLSGNTNIVVTYKAVLNAEAVIYGSANTNDASLKYGNDHTVDSQTKTYSYQFDLAKTNDGTELLGGAEFKLYEQETGGSAIKLVKISETSYRVALDGETVNVTDTIVTVAGKVTTISGLAGKTYYLEEAKAPEGYNLLTSRTSVDMTQESVYKATVSAAGAYKDGGKQVINQAGTLLPSTGGMGTTLFYVIGGGLMVAAAVLLITKKRMERKN